MSILEERLAGTVTLADLERILTAAGNPSRPVIVGHDPDFSELLALLVGAAEVPMRKGAIARVDLPGRWSRRAVCCAGCCPRS